MLPSTPRTQQHSAEHSEFYQLLTTPEFQHLYDAASRECKTICIPPDHHVLAYAEMVDSLKSKLQAFITNHILRDSPILQGQFFTENAQCLREVDPEELAREQSSQRRYGLQPRTYHKVLLTVKGFRTRFRVNVIAEEIFYNQDYKPFRIWFIDRCIINEHEQIMQQAQAFANTGNSQEIHTDHDPDNLREFEAWLRRLDRPLFDGLQNYIRVFNTSYVLLRGFEQQTVEKLRDYQEQLTYDFLDAHPELEQNADGVLLLKNAINSVLISGLYDKLFQYWQQMYKEQDQTMALAIANIAYITMNDLEIPEDFQCDLTDAIDCLRGITSRQNPYEKMKCIKSTNDIILNSINKHLTLRSMPTLSGGQSSQQNSSAQSGIPLTTDELLPILSYVIIKAAPASIASNIQFATEFQIDELAASEYSFSLVSMEASCEFIRRESEQHSDGFFARPSFHNPSNSIDSPSTPGKREDLFHMDKDIMSLSLQKGKDTYETDQYKLSNQGSPVPDAVSADGAPHGSHSVAARSSPKFAKSRTPRSRVATQQDSSLSIIQQFEKKLSFKKGKEKSRADFDDGNGGGNSSVVKNEYHRHRPNHRSSKRMPLSFNIDSGRKKHDIGGLLDFLEDE